MSEQTGRRVAAPIALHRLLRFSEETRARSGKSSDSGQVLARTTNRRPSRLGTAISAKPDPSSHYDPFRRRRESASRCMPALILAVAPLPKMTGYQTSAKLRKSASAPSRFASYGLCSVQSRRHPLPNGRGSVQHAGASLANGRGSVQHTAGVRFVTVLVQCAPQQH
jgi:hypothetical protein